MKRDWNESLPVGFIEAHTLDMKKMRSLIEADDRPAAAEYYGGGLSNANVTIASGCLADHIAASEHLQPNPALEWAVSLLSLGELDAMHRQFLCSRYIFDMYEKLPKKVGASTRRSLLNAIALSLTNLMDAEPMNVWDCKRGLAMTHCNIGDVRMLVGDLDGALDSYRTSQALWDEWKNPYWQFHVSVIHDKIGNIQRSRSDLASASESYHQCLTVAKNLMSSGTLISYPRDLDTARRRLVWVACSKIAAIKEQTGDEALDWWLKAFDTLSDMKSRGLDISPQDEQQLEKFRLKVGE